MTALVLAVLAMLAGALTVVAVAVFRGSRASNQAVLNEFAFFTVAAIALTAGILLDTSVVFDLALIAALVGLLSALSLARLITRGAR